MFVLRRLLFLVLFVQSAFSVARADELGDLEDALTGLWVVKVGKESRTRTLKIHSVEMKSRGLFLLDADYGRYSGEKSPIQVELKYESKELTLTFITPNQAKVVATEKSEGKFSGSFVVKNGATKDVALSKVPPGELEAFERIELNAFPDVQPASPDVPSSCASFLGGWTGIPANVGRFWLWIVEIDRNCVVKYSYGTSPAVPNEFKTAEIQNGVLTIPYHQGHATFEVQGAELIRRNFGTGGKSRSLIAQKVNTSDGSIARIRSEQGADRPREIPPGQNVPPSCAAFFGSWAGTWARGRPRFLHVFAVNANCVATYSYTLGQTQRIFYRGEIKDGLLAFRCNENLPPICSFRRKGDTLDAEIHSGRGRPNTGVFRKMQ